MAMTGYSKDIVAWAHEQAELLRSGQFAALDIEHIAEEIEDVGKSEQRELASRIAVLLAHLLKWQYQPARRGRSWQATIREQRKSLAIAIKQTPSLKNSLADKDWCAAAWADASAKAIEETGLDTFPENCPWPMDQVLSQDFFPEDPL